MTACRIPCSAALLATLLAASVPAAGPPMSLARSAFQDWPPAVPREAPLVPTVSIRVRVPAEVAPGQDLTYRITAANDSAAVAHHVTVRIPLPGEASLVKSDPAPSDKSKALLWKFGTFKPGERKTITLVLKPGGSEDVQLCAYVQFEHGLCARTRVRDRPKTTLPPPTPSPAPALSFRKTGPAEAARYDSITYKLEVRNLGREALRDVVVEDRLPAGLEFLNSQPAAKGTATLTWDLGELGPGKSRVIEYQAAAREVGLLENKAVARAAGGARREASFKTRVRLPRLQVALSWPAIRAVGRDFTYRITVRNPDTLTAKGVQVSDDLIPDKDDMEFVSATGGGALSGRNVEWELGDLKPGESKTVDVTVKAKRAGTFKNAVTVTETRGVREQAIAVTEIFDAGPLFLEADGDRPALAVGQQASVAVRAVNAGQAAEKNVRLTILLPDGLRALDVKGVSGARIAGRTVALPGLAEIKAGDRKGVTLIVQATRPGSQRLSFDLRSARTDKDSPLRTDLTFDVRVAGK